jgi:hypothetical protein
VFNDLYSGTSGPFESTMREEKRFFPLLLPTSASVIFDVADGRQGAYNDVRFVLATRLHSETTGRR